MPEQPPFSLHGLVLTGGASSRMGRDKASIVYHGAPQWQAAAALLRACGAEPFWSCSAVQADEWKLGDRAVLDLIPGHGPASGLHAAFSRGDAAAWLVIGCDYPQLEAENLRQLVNARSAGIDAVVYLNHETNEIDPMIALWEPAAQRQFLRSFANGEYSARRILRTCALGVLSPRTPQMLVNRNDASPAPELT